MITFVFIIILEQKLLSDNLYVYMYRYLNINVKISINMIKLVIDLFFQTESLTQTSVFINGEYFKPTSYTGLPQNPENVILNIGTFKFISINALFSY